MEKFELNIVAIELNDFELFSFSVHCQKFKLHFGAIGLNDLLSMKASWPQLPLKCDYNKLKGQVS